MRPEIRKKGCWGCDGDCGGGSDAAERTSFFLLRHFQRPRMRTHQIVAAGKSKSTSNWEVLAPCTRRNGGLRQLEVTQGKWERGRGGGVCPFPHETGLPARSPRT